MHAKITLSDAGRQRRGVDSTLDELDAIGSDRQTPFMFSVRPVLILALVGACSPPSPDASSAEARRAAAAADSSFAEVQSRGHAAMGVDQYTSTHLFQPLPDGGRIELQRDTADSAGRVRILEHMREIAAAFGAGDFTVPGFVHAREVPGTSVMAARRSRIRYVVESLPRGAAVRLTTEDASAIEAIHEFLAFQGQDHRAGAHPRE
jgi:hypothetical protein